MKTFRKYVYTMFHHKLIAFIAIGLLAACGGGGGILAIGGAVAAFLGGSAAPVVPLVLFPGGENQKPAVLLPFTSEVASLAVTADGNTLYAGDRFHNTVAIIDLTSRRTVDVLDVGTGPRTLAVSPDGAHLVAAHWGSIDVAGDSVSLISTATGQVTAVLPTGTRPYAIAITSDSRIAYVVCQVSTNGFGTVTVIDLQSAQVIKDVELSLNGVDGFQPVAIGLTSDDAKAYIVNRGTNNVAIIDLSTDTLVGFIDVGIGPSGLVMMPDDQIAYVINSDLADKSVSVIDITLDQQVSKIQLSAVGGPLGIVASPDGSRLYVANALGENEDDACLQNFDLPADASEFDNTVSVIDTASQTLVGPDVVVGRAPLGLVITGNSERLFVLSACDPELAAVTTDTLNVEFVPVEARSTAITIAPDSSEIYLAHPHAISVLPTAAPIAVAKVIPVRGDGPIQMALANNGATLVTLHSGIDRVALTDVSGGFVAQAATGKRPGRLAVVSRAGLDDTVWVANSGFSRSPGSTITRFDIDGAGNPILPLTQIDLAPDALDPVNPRLGKGPVSLLPLVDSEEVLVAAFGDFYPNNRGPGRIVYRVPMGNQDVTPIQSFMWPIHLAQPPGPATFVWGADFFDHLAFTIDSVPPSTPPPPIPPTGLNLPASIASSQTDTFFANYVSTATFAALVRDDNTALNLSEPVSNKVAVVPGSTLAVVLHAGDRGQFCDGGDICDIGRTVSVVDLVNFNQFATVTVGRRPTDIVFSLDGSTALVANYFDHNVAVIDLVAAAASFGTTIDASGFVDVGKGPEMLLRSGAGDQVYVANSIDNTVSVIDISDPGNIDQTSVSTLVDLTPHLP